MFRCLFRRTSAVAMAAGLTQAQQHPTHQQTMFTANQQTEQIEYEPKFSVHITDALLNALMGKETRTRVNHNIGGLDFVPVHPVTHLAAGQSVIESSTRSELNAADTPYQSPSTTIVTTDEFDTSSQSSHATSSHRANQPSNSHVDESLISEALERGRQMGREEAYRSLQPLLEQTELARQQAVANRRAEERQIEVDGLNQLQKDMALISSSSKSRPIKRPVCEQETTELLACYKKFSSTDAIQCAPIVHAYSKCAEHARNRTATE